MRAAPPVALERMLRIYFLQHWYNLSDPAVEEALYDSHAMRQFVGIDPGRESAPDETTVCKFRHLLERHGLGEKLFQEVMRYLEASGFRLSRGTIVDATIIAAPSSTRNQQQARDPKMHQARKGNRWYFGMKTHIGMDRRLRLIHSVAATAANVHDAHLLPDLLTGEEAQIWGDSAYRGQKQAISRVVPKARDRTNQRRYHHSELTPAEREKNRRKPAIPARVEHAFYILKRLFGFDRVRYRGLAKNMNRLLVACALTNLYQTRRPLLRLAQA